MNEYLIGFLAGLTTCALYIIINFREVTHPSCYKSDPSPQSQAENCCDGCPFENECLA